MMKFDHSSEGPGEDEAENGNAAETRHFEIDVGEVEIGEDEAVGKLNRDKEEAYLRNRALIDVVLERGERLLEAHLQARDDRLVEAIASRVRLSSAATVPVSLPRAAEPMDSLSTAGRATPSAPLSYQQRDSFMPTASFAGAKCVRRRRHPEGVREGGSAGEPPGPGTAAFLQRRLMTVRSAAGVGESTDGREDVLLRSDATQAGLSSMPPRRRRPLNELRVTGAVAVAVAGGPFGAGAAEPR